MIRNNENHNSRYLKTLTITLLTRRQYQREHQVGWHPAVHLQYCPTTQHHISRTSQIHYQRGYRSTCGGVGRAGRAGGSAPRASHRLTVGPLFVARLPLTPHSPFRPLLPWSKLPCLALIEVTCQRKEATEVN